MKTIERNGIELLQFEILQKPKLFHFSTTIQGGVSREAYSSFNLSLYSGDDIQHVIANRLKLSDAVGISIKRLFIPYQTHEDKVLVIDEAFLSLSNEEQLLQLSGIDALITNRKDVCIGVTTADCVPILLFDPEKKVLASIHAGWKGTVQRIAKKVALKMIDQYGCNSQNILAGIAPSISPEIFEVGDEVGKAFTDKGFDLSSISFRNQHTGKLHIDLWEANRLQLVDAGLLPKNIEVAGMCTYKDADLFFSARRQTIHSGRMVTGGIITD